MEAAVRSCDPGVDSPVKLAFTWDKHSYKYTHLSLQNDTSDTISVKVTRRSNQI